jgi:hypothetical protein
VSQSHKTNLAVEVLSQLPIVAGIEELLQNIYTFFCKSPKKHTEFVRLAELMETKGNKILRYANCYLSKLHCGLASGLHAIGNF